MATNERFFMTFEYRRKKDRQTKTNQQKQTLIMRDRQKDDRPTETERNRGRQKR